MESSTFVSPRFKKWIMSGVVIPRAFVLSMNCTWNVPVFFRNWHNTGFCDAEAGFKDKETRLILLGENL